MSATSCTFAFSDGRRCRTPRQPGHPLFCCFHARKFEQSHAADQLGREIAQFFSRDYLSACDLNTALGRLFAATARGHVPPKTVRALAYLAQVMVQCIHLGELEYINAFSTDTWRRSVRSSVNSNSALLSPVPPTQSLPRVAPPQPTGATPSAPQGAPAVPSSQPTQPAFSTCCVKLSRQSHPPSPSFTPVPSAPVEAGLEPGHSSAPTDCATRPAQPPPSTRYNQPRPAPSSAANLKSQLKQLLASELAPPVAKAPSQPSAALLSPPASIEPEPKLAPPPAPPQRSADGALTATYPPSNNHDDDDDRDDEFESLVLTPAMRRRQSRTRV